MLILVLLALGIVQPQEYESWQKEALYGNGENSTYVKKDKTTYVKNYNPKFVFKSQKKVWIREALDPRD